MLPGRTSVGALGRFAPRCAVIENAVIRARQTIRTNRVDMGKSLRRLSYAILIQWSLVLSWIVVLLLGSLAAAQDAPTIQIEVTIPKATVYARPGYWRR